MSSRKTTFGFGVDPAESQNHFFVVVPLKSSTDSVSIFERFSWTPPTLLDALPEKERPKRTHADKQIFANGQVLERSDILRLEISRHKWNLLYKDLTAEFNARLKDRHQMNGTFSIGGTPVERLFGKEMMVLLWAVEDCDPSVIPTAIRNWKGLMPEERWWLYTMTNASTGHIKDRKGWRTALRYALCENPIEERPQVSIFDYLDEEDSQK